MFGGGLTDYSPFYVEDVAEAVAALQCADTDAATFECGGPLIVHVYRGLLRR